MELVSDYIGLDNYDVTSMDISRLESETIGNSPKSSQSSETQNICCPVCFEIANISKSRYGYLLSECRKSEKKI